MFYALLILIILFIILISYVLWSYMTYNTDKKVVKERALAVVTEIKRCMVLGVAGESQMDIDNWIDKAKYFGATNKEVMDAIRLGEELAKRDIT